MPGEAGYREDRRGAWATDSSKDSPPRASGRPDPFGGARPNDRSLFLGLAGCGRGTAQPGRMRTTTGEGERPLRRPRMWQWRELLVRNAWPYECATSSVQLNVHEVWKFSGVLWRTRCPTLWRLLRVLPERGPKVGKGRRSERLALSMADVRRRVTTPWPISNFLASAYVRCFFPTHDSSDVFGQKHPQCRPLGSSE